MNNDVISLISSEEGKFSKGQKRIAEYIKANYDKAAFMTAGRLGEAVGVSESTVVRFAADLGFPGYPEMRQALKELVKNRLTSVQRIAVAKDKMGSGDIVGAMMTADVEKIHTTMEHLDRRSFDEAVTAITEAKNIYILGLRSSAALASFLGFYLMLLFPGVRVVSEGAASGIYEQLLRIGPGDVLIGLSFPRYSKRTVKAMQFARDQGAAVVGITDTENSAIARIATISLYARSDMVSFLDSLVAPLSLINALIVAAANRSEYDLTENFNRLEGIWADYDVYEKPGQ